MSKSSNLKRKGGNLITKKMILGRMQDLANLTTAMETVMMEWEIWFRLVKMQKVSLERSEITQAEYEYFINDGPPFTDMSARIMSSVRENIPNYTAEKQEQDSKAPTPAILGGDGFAANNTVDTPKILGSDGKLIK